MISHFRRLLNKWLRNQDDSLHFAMLHHEIYKLNKKVDTLTNQLENTMTALENLTKAVTDLQGAVDEAVTAINTPHPTDAQVQSAADAVQAQVARLRSALEPVEPPVEPAPVV